MVDSILMLIMLIRWDHEGFYGMNMMGHTCYDQVIGFDNNEMSSQCCDSNSSTIMGDFDDPTFYFF